MIKAIQRYKQELAFVKNSGLLYTYNLVLCKSYEGNDKDRDKDQRIRQNED